MLLGLTGGYCAGKDAAAALLMRRGWTCIDVDALGHEALAIAGDEVAARFGRTILGSDGSIDRRALGRRVFSRPAELEDLERITHPIMTRLLDGRIAEAELAARAAGEEERTCVNAAVLYSLPQAAECAAILELRAPLAVRLARARRRDGLGAFAALQRVMRQRKLWRRRPRAGAGGARVLPVRNAAGPPELETAVERALELAMACGLPRRRL